MKSMTGYGQSIRADGGERIRVEVRSVNHRGLDVQVRGFQDFRLEEGIKREVAAKVARGKLDVRVHLPAPWQGPNLSEIKRFVQRWKRLQQQLGVSGEVDLKWVFSHLSSESDGVVDPRRGKQLRRMAAEALQNLNQDRLREGKALEKDFQRRVGHMEGLLRKLKAGSSVEVAREKKRWLERLRSLTERAPLDAGRVEQEVFLFVQRADVTEELVRISEHVRALKNVLSQTGAVGRRMDFLLQEIHRELNTIGAKVRAASLMKWVFEGKEEVEKMREQAQNVE